MIIDIFKSLLEMVWALCKWPIIIILVFIGIMFILCVFWLIYYRIKGIEPKQGEHYKVKEPKLLVKLFYLAPKQFALDRLNRDPEFFKYQGLIIYTGNQGLITGSFIQ
jgi:hypothetical protein